MNRITVHAPYLGTLPTMLPFWAKSCAFNSTVRFLLFTDAKIPCTLPANVEVGKTTLNAVEQMGWEKTGASKLSIASPHKLCDSSSMYGETFSGYLQGTDFWECCDIDMIYQFQRKMTQPDFAKEMQLDVPEGSFLGSNGFTAKAPFLPVLLTNLTP
ncbi:MAG: DUF6625 family protein [Lentisphaeria bacterium]